MQVCTISAKKISNVLLEPLVRTITSQYTFFKQVRRISAKLTTYSRTFSTHQCSVSDPYHFDADPKYCQTHYNNLEFFLLQAWTISAKNQQPLVRTITSQYTFFNASVQNFCKKNNNVLFNLFYATITTFSTHYNNLYNSFLQVCRISAKKNIFFYT